MDYLMRKTRAFNINALSLTYWQMSSPNWFLFIFCCVFVNLVVLNGTLLFPPLRPWLYLECRFLFIEKGISRFNTGVGERIYYILKSINT